MAGVVKVKFDADAQKALQALDKQNRKLEREVETLKKIKGESKKTSDQQVKGYGDQGKAAEGVAGKIGDIKNALVGAAGVSAAIALVRQDFQQWKQEVQEFTLEFGKLQKTATSFASDFANQPEARKAYEQFISDAQKIKTTSGTSLEQRQGVLNALRKNASTISLDDTLRYGQSLLSLDAAGFDPVQAGLIGGAFLDQIGTENITPTQLRDLTASSIQRAGQGKAGQLLTSARVIGLGRQAGFTTEESLGLAIANIKATGSTEGSEAALRKVVEEREIKPVPPEQLELMSDKDLMARQFYFEKDPRKRMNMLMNNPRMAQAVMGEMGPKFSLTAQRAPAFAAGLSGDVGGAAFYEQMVLGNLQSPKFMTEAKLEAAQAKNILASSALGERTAAVQAGRDELEASLKADPMVSRTERSLRLRYYDAVKYAEEEEYRYYAPGGKAEKRRERVEELSGINLFGHLAQNTKALDDNTRALKEKKSQQASEAF